MTWDGTDLASMMGLGSEPSSVAGSMLGSLDGTHHLTAAPSFLREGCGDAQGGSFLLPLVTLFMFNSPPSCSDMTPQSKSLLVLSQHQSAPCHHSKPTVAGPCLRGHQPGTPRHTLLS